MGLLFNTALTFAHTFPDRTTFTWGKFRGAFEDVANAFTKLLSTDTGEGASQVGVEDAALIFDGDDVEAVLRELGAKRCLISAVYDATVSGKETIATHGLGIFLPDNAVVTRAWIEILTTFQSTAGGVDKAVLSLTIPTDDADGLRAPTAIENATDWDAGFHECIQDGAAANFSTQTTAIREISLKVATAALTAGKLVACVEYVVLP